MKHPNMYLALGLAFLGGHAAAAGWVGQFNVTTPGKTVQAGQAFSGSLHMGGPCDVALTFTRGALSKLYRIDNLNGGQPYSGQFPTKGLIGGDLEPGVHTVVASSTNPAKCTTSGTWSDTLTVIAPPPPPPPPPPVLNLSGISLSTPTPKVGQPVTVTVHGTGRCAFTINDGGITNTGAMKAPGMITSVGASAVDLNKSLPYSFQLTPGNEGQYTLSANPVMGPGMSSSCSGGAKSIQVLVTSNTMAPKLVLSKVGIAHQPETREFGYEKFYQDGEVMTWRVHNQGNLASLPAKLRVSCVMEHIQKIGSKENTLTRCMDGAGLNQPISRSVDIPALPPGGGMDVNLNGKPVFVAQKRYRGCNCVSASCERVGYTGYRVKVAAEILRNAADPNQGDDKITMASSANDHEPESYFPPKNPDGTFPPSCNNGYGGPTNAGGGVSGSYKHYP